LEAKLQRCYAYDPRRHRYQHSIAGNNEKHYSQMEKKYDHTDVYCGDDGVDMAGSDKGLSRRTVSDQQPTCDGWHMTYRRSRVSAVHPPHRGMRRGTSTLWLGGGQRWSWWPHSTLGYIVDLSAAQTARTSALCVSCPTRSTVRYTQTLLCTKETKG